MTEPTSNGTSARLEALRAARGSARAATGAPASTKPKTSTGPKPSRIVAAAASVSAGIGLVALMAGAQQDIVVQVNPAPVTVQPANIVVEMTSPTTGDATVVADVAVRSVEPATPVDRAAPEARVVSQSEGS